MLLNKTVGGGGGRRLQRGNYKHIFFRMCSMPSCANADPLKAKCKSWDALRSASKSPTVKTIDGSGCQRNEFSKHPLSISKHRKIQAFPTGRPLQVLWYMAIKEGEWWSNRQAGEHPEAKTNCVAHLMSDALTSSKLQLQFVCFGKIQGKNVKNFRAATSKCCHWW